MPVSPADILAMYQRICLAGGWCMVFFNDKNSRHLAGIYSPPINHTHILFSKNFNNFKQKPFNFVISSEGVIPH